ncbi:pectate lyase [Treponema pectinovorum]|uniref:pectate lyase n=1 Tax=Treponema pectinovorum TaxID=164 RepID=UPI003D938DA2
MKNINFLMVLAILLSSCVVSSQNFEQDFEQEEFFKLTSKSYNAIDIKDFSDGFNHARYSYPNSIPPWSLYNEDNILGFAENMIYTQNPDGGWAKNLDLQRIYTIQELKQIREQNKNVPPVTYGLKTSSNASTMDNGNIHSQIKYLCQVYQQVKDDKSIDSKRYLDCATKALTWIFNAQHPVSGGFTGADVYAITYNDNVMTNSFTLLKDISNGKDYFCVFPEETRQKAKSAYERGIECILKTQITLTLDDGTKILTAWCQQHNHETLKPVWAREFEPPSVCSSESFKVLRFLMTEENPTPEIKKAIIAGCEFFDRNDVKIFGKKLVATKLASPRKENGRTYNTDKTLQDSEPSDVLWARFYALDSSFDVVSGARKPIVGTYPSVLKPIWCDRGCKYVDSFNELSFERRNGYGYTTTSGRSLSSAYSAWKAKHEL